MIEPISGAVGTAITFNGYADDYDKAIKAVQFSLDNGETWNEFATEGASSKRWVYWSFSYTPECAGNYTLRVRAVNEDGKASPVSDLVKFTAV